MVIVLPDPGVSNGWFPDFGTMGPLTSGLYTTELNLRIPRFKVEFDSEEQFMIPF